MLIKLTLKPNTLLAKGEFSQVLVEGLKNSNYNKDISMQTWTKFQRVDFWVPYDPDPQKQATMILDYILLYRTERKKQTVLVLTGGPGEAKSSISQKLTEVLLEYRNIVYLPYVSDVTVYTPIEFPQKEEALLHDKRLKKIPIMIIDEARLVVKAKNWQAFLNQAIADVFALQRRVKTFLLIIVTQDLEDIDKDVRRLITYWGECYRPLNGAAQLKLSTFWKDTRDPEKIKLKKRPIRGIIELPNGKRKLDYPKLFTLRMPSKEVWNKYDHDNFENKGAIIKHKLEEMMEKMKKDVGLKEKPREEILSEYYLTTEKYQELLFHMKRTNRGKYKLKPGADKLLGLTSVQAKKFEALVIDGMSKLKEELENGVQKSNFKYYK